MNEKIVDEMSLNEVSNSEESKSSHKHTEPPKWYSRLAAWLIDNLILMLILYPIAILLGFFSALGAGELRVAISTLISVLVVLTAVMLYFTILQSRNGQTWGMKFVGIKISFPDGSKLNFQTAFLRNLFVILLPSILGIIPILGIFIQGIFYLILGISVLTNKNGQGFHDKMFGVVFSKLNEKTTGSKIFIGCYCGCLSVTVIFLIIGFVFFGMAASLSGENLKNLGIDQNLQKMIQEEMPRENQTENKIKDSYMEEVREEDEISEEQSLNNNSQGNEFYKACMEANTNESLDLSDYCACAEKEFMNGGDLNSIVSACKERIKIK
jgi:uncharacterized RDD family membrane protein YckC